MNISHLQQRVDAALQAARDIHELRIALAEKIAEALSTEETQLEQEGPTVSGDIAGGVRIRIIVGKRAEGTLRDIPYEGFRASVFLSAGGTETHVKSEIIPDEGAAQIPGRGFFDFEKDINRMIGSLVQIEDRDIARVVESLV